MCLCPGVHLLPENEFRNISRKANIIIALVGKSDFRFCRRKETSRKNMCRFLWIVITRNSARQLSMHVINAKNRHRKFQKQSNTIRMMCLERGIHTPHRRCVRPKLVVQNGQNGYVVKRWRAKPQDREMRIRSQQRACSSAKPANKALCNTNIKLGCWMVLVDEERCMDRGWTCNDEG